MAEDDWKGWKLLTDTLGKKKDGRQIGSCF
jgi:hypothetical protein